MAGTPVLWRMASLGAVACAAAVLAAPAAATVPAAQTADRILAEARAGESASAILAGSFPGARIGTAANPPLRVLVADLAPRVIVAAHSRPAIISRGRRVALVADHRYEVSRTRRGWRVRDLDGAGRVRALRTGTLRVLSRGGRPQVLLADPLDRRFRGELQLRAGERRTIAVVNRVPTELWARAAAAGEVPGGWLSGAPRAMDVAAVLARSRGLAALAAHRGGWDLTSDDPLYLGVDGERAAATAATLRTRGEALMSAGSPVDGIVPIVRPPGDAFLPDPGHPQPVAAAPARPIAGAPAGLGPRAVALAEGRLGTPYRWGGAAPGGFDCSGLVYWVYRSLGITLPRVAEDQGRVGVPVAMGDLRPGDVVFFADSSGYVHHEGIYIGGARMIHAPQTGDVVKVERIDSGYYARQYAGARRFSPTG
jgi:cell wall-associated NlpC family hydrolase